MRKLWSACALVALSALPQLHANAIYNFSGTIPGGIAENAQVEFDIFTTVGSGGCASTAPCLRIIIANNESNPTTIAQGIIGLTFDVSTAGSPLTNVGSLVVNGSNVAQVTNGMGGQITSINFSSTPPTETQTNNAPGWSYAYRTTAGNGCLASNVFCLGDLPGGQPTNMIIGDGPYTHGGSLVPHTPELESIVAFEVDNFTGLTALSSFSNVSLVFGTNPDGSLPGTLCTDCGGTILDTPTPEPVTTMLAGAGLLAIGLIGRKACKRS